MYSINRSLWLLGMLNRPVRDGHGIRSEQLRTSSSRHHQDGDWHTARTGPKHCSARPHTLSAWMYGETVPCRPFLWENVNPARRGTERSKGETSGVCPQQHCCTAALPWRVTWMWAAGPGGGARLHVIYLLRQLPKELVVHIVWHHLRPRGGSAPRSAAQRGTV